MKRKNSIPPLNLRACLFALALLASPQAVLANIDEIEGIPLKMKEADVEAYVRSAPAGTGVARSKAQDGGSMITLAKGNDGRVLRFTTSGDLLMLGIEHRAMPMSAYRKSVLDFIWQHGTPNYVGLPKVSGYPAGADKACLSPSSKQGKAIVDVACLERHFPKEPQSFASWVVTYIARTGRQPDLFWSCKTSKSGPAILPPKAEPPNCFVKLYAGNDCVGTGDEASCHQFVRYANFSPSTGSPEVAQSEQRPKAGEEQAAAAPTEKAAPPPTAPTQPSANTRESKRQKSPDDLIAEGKAALAQGHPDVALRKLRIAKMKAGGASPELRELIAAAEKGLDDAKGVTDEDQARKERVRAALRNANEAGHFKNYDAQLGALSEALAIDPKAVSALKSRKQVYEKLGKPDLALKDAETLLAIDSSDAFARQDVARLKKQLSASRRQSQPSTTEQAADNNAAQAAEAEAPRPPEKLEKPYDINGLPLNSNLAAIEKFLKARTGKSFKRSESDGEVELEGDADDGIWLVRYDTDNKSLLRAEFTSRRIPEKDRRETYAAIMRKYGMPYYIKTDYGKLLAQRASSYANASQELKDDFATMDQCYSTCCGGSDKNKKCAPSPPVNTCFNDCYYPKPPQDAEALLKWLFSANPTVAQKRLLYDGVRPTYWSCARFEPADVLRNREQHTCNVSFEAITHKADFDFTLRFANGEAIARRDKQQSEIRKVKEKIAQEKASQARADAYRREKAAKEARYAAIDAKIAKRYPLIAQGRLEFLRDKWRSYEDFKVWMANELKQPYWQKIPEAERETKLLEALTTNEYLPGGPNYNDPHMRNALQDYLHFEDRRRSFDTDNTRAMIDKTTADPQFASITDEKARRTAAIASLQKRHPEQMKAYLAELDKIRDCYNNGSVEAGRIGGAMTYSRAPGCWGYTTARDVNLGMAKRPNWEP
ncbi:MAG: hypothetical protein R3D51_03465 [Hyphomicrobiaceae bacterium]